MQSWGWHGYLLSVSVLDAAHLLLQRSCREDEIRKLLSNLPWILDPGFHGAPLPV